MRITYYKTDKIKQENFLGEPAVCRVGLPFLYINRRRDIMAKKAIDEILKKEKDCGERLDAAKKKADAEYTEIIAAAEKRKQEITDNAKKQADKILADAKAAAGKEYEKAKKTAAENRERIVSSTEELKEKSVEVVEDMLFGE